jgi:hypothetical protein
MPLRAKALVLGLVAALMVPVAAVASNDDPDFRRAKLFRDGSVSCSGADDTSRKGGRVLGLAQPGEIHFTVKLRGGEPNASYLLRVSKEPNCLDVQDFGPKTTNAQGDATFYGTYTAVSSGPHNLLFNLVTTNPGTARNREIATRDFKITVPSP